MLVPVIAAPRGSRSLNALRWGLVPPWADDPKVGYRMINARSETAATKPAFRGAWKHRRRCLIPATGFYEWQKGPEPKAPKTPYWIQRADGRPFAFAGLWETWRGKEADAPPLHSFTILTTSPNPYLERIHDRMPVILGEEKEWARWLDPQVASPEVADLLRPYPPEEMHAHPVSTYVNKPGNEGPACVEAVGEGV
jgi:putative SOS response-associated peptidase YedK